jgi:AhpD family alkylhydroperoxidase
MTEPHPVSPTPARELAEKRKALAPRPAEAFKAFTQSVFAETALLAKSKQLITIAVAHVTQCPYCIRNHTKAALAHGASPEEIMESIWVAAEMRAGGAHAHLALALDTITQHASQRPGQS